jgi:truncated hemoglobin YjbI
MMQSIFEQIEQLPPHLQEKVAIFINSLTQQSEPKQGIKLTQNWGGAMKQYRNQYTSLELQQETINHWIIVQH